MLQCVCVCVCASGAMGGDLRVPWTGIWSTLASREQGNRREGGRDSGGSRRRGRTLEREEGEETALREERIRFITTERSCRESDTKEVHCRATYMWSCKWALVTGPVCTAQCVCQRGATFLWSDSSVFMRSRGDLQVRFSVENTARQSI